MFKPFENPPVPHLQNEWEIKKFVELYQLNSPKKVMEIGSFYGATLWLWMNYSDDLERIVSLDWSIPPTDGRYLEMIESKKKWRSWTNADKLIALEGNSQSLEMINNVRALFPDNDIDLLVIDGDHTYHGVKSDWLNYKDLVRAGGIIAFHDVVGLGDVRKFWDEIKHQHRYMEIFSNEGGWGWGIIFI